MNNIKTNILQLNDGELKEKLIALDFKKSTCKQLEEVFWKQGVRSFDEISFLSEVHRNILHENFTIHPIVEDKMERSSDGTLKFLFRLHDGKKIESVLIPVLDAQRFTLCVSSQAGCSLTCLFCATGRMGLLRQLSVNEIYDQFALVNRKCKEIFGHGVTNIVYMGMGEPLLNYHNVVNSIHRFCSAKGASLSHRKITISTAGISKMIKKLADDQVKANLAISLHAADDQKRNKLMPINESNNIHSLVEATTYYYQKIKHRISFEYITFHEINDTEQDAMNIIELCRHFPVIVNLIEYNAITGFDFEKSSESRIQNFAKMIRAGGIMVSIRRSRGKDINAACGQLVTND